MKEQINKTDWKHMNRKQRGKLIYKRKTIKKTAKGWRVQSQSNPSKSYLVKFNGHNPKCECSDCQMRKKKCKHIHAVELYIKEEIDEDGNVKRTKGMKVTYKQDWKAYNEAQTNEKLVFMKLLRDLCNTVEQPEYEFGRPKLPISDMIFNSALKVYTTFSLRRFKSDMKIAKEFGLIDKTCSYVTVSNYMKKEELTPILKRLIKLSATPLKEVEQDFGVDASGFSTSRFARWFDHKWGKEKKKRVWLKAHLTSGVKTNIVTSVEITEGTKHDSKEFSNLINETAKNFNINEVSADKAYSSRDNLKLVKDKGGEAFIPFKKNVTGKAKGSMYWKKMYHYFMYKNDEFMEHYHKRSNAETVFHMIKAKFGDSISSKKRTSQVNELLLKVLCHNICVVIQEIKELGVKAEFQIEEDM